MHFNAYGLWCSTSTSFLNEYHVRADLCFKAKVKLHLCLTFFWYYEVELQEKMFQAKCRGDTGSITLKLDLRGWFSIYWISQLLNLATWIWFQLLSLRKRGNEKKSTFTCSQLTEHFKISINFILYKHTFSYGTQYSIQNLQLVDPSISYLVVL